MNTRLIGPCYCAMAAIAVLTSGCSSGPGPAQAQTMPPPEVGYLEVDARDVPVSYEFVGVTEPSKTVEIRARVRGFLESRRFEEGSVVNEGALLFEIDPLPFKADREISASRVEQAQAQLVLAEQDLDRLSSLRRSGAIAESELDEATAQFANAKASLRLATAELAKAELQLGYTSIASPLTGTIGKTLKEPGSYVDDGGNSLLAVVTQVDPIYVSFNVSEREYLTWLSDTEAQRLTLNGSPSPVLRITFLDGQEYELPGEVNFFDTKVSDITGTVQLRGVFPNPGNRLKPGQFVKVRIDGYSRAATIAIPQRAVNQSPAGPFVYVVGANNSVEFRPVTLGEWAGTDWIIQDGLVAGDRVIVEGTAKAQPGSPVQPVPVSTDAAVSPAS